MKKLISLVVAVAWIALPVWANKQIVILDISDAGSNLMNVNYLFWLTTPNPIAKPNIQSRWTGASAAEVAALQAGTIVEEPHTIAVSSGTSTTALKAVLNAAYTSRQTYFNQQPGPGLWYGIFYDSSTAWSQ